MDCIFPTCIRTNHNLTKFLKKNKYDKYELEFYQHNRVKIVKRWLICHFLKKEGANYLFYYYNKSGDRARFNIENIGGDLIFMFDEKVCLFNQLRLLA